MKKLASTSVALTLAAAFALAAIPSTAQDTAPAPVAGQQQQYEDLRSLIEQTGAQHDARRADIAAAIRENNPDISDTALALQTERQLNNELARESAERWQSLESDRQGAPHIDLPDAFFKAVRGCSTDGQIYRLTYNLTVNFDELAAPPGPNTPDHERSLLYRLVQPNPESILGVSGTDRFLEALQTMTEGVHNSMQVIAGRIMDESPGAFMERPIFTEVLELATREITEDFKDRYGVTITIRTDQPRQQAGACAPAALPERLPQPDTSAPQ